MLVHLSPCEEDVAETICSLSFAKRARAIETSRELQEVEFLNFLSSFSKSFLIWNLAKNSNVSFRTRRSKERKKLQCWMKP